jgi:hypothetical protein
MGLIERTERAWIGLLLRRGHRVLLLCLAVGLPPTALAQENPFSINGSPQPIPHCPNRRDLCLLDGGCELLCARNSG